MTAFRTPHLGEAGAARPPISFGRRCHAPRADSSGLSRPGRPGQRMARWRATRLCNHYGGMRRIEESVVRA
jgi:hypothetical protein